MLKKGVAAGVPSSPGYLPGVYVQKLQELADNRGLDFPALLSRLPESASFPLERARALDIDYADYLAFVRVLLDAVEHAGQRDGSGMGLRFGRRFSVQDYGILGYVMLSCRNLGQCLRTFQNLNDLFSNLAELDRRFVWRDTEVAYRCTSHLVDADLARFELETAFAQFMNLRNLLGEPERFQLLHVSFEFARPAVTADYEKLFQCPIHFNRQETELVLPVSVLENPFALANEEVWMACEQQCEVLLRGMRRVGLLSEAVRRLVLQSPGSIPDLADIARQMNVSARTLRRKLAQENTSYNEIIRNVREYLARRYLVDTGLQIKEISHLLGYSEVANFQRAFKKWVGWAPGEYRAIRTE